MTPRIEKFLAALPEVKAEQWAVVRREDTRGSLQVVYLTHSQGQDTYYGWINGEALEAAFRTVKLKKIIERFADQTSAEQAVARGWAAWESHYGAVTKAKAALNDREKAREDSMWKAVRGV